MKDWKGKGVVLVLVVSVLMLGTARSEVADSAANGFTVKITVDINAAPAEVYRKLLGIGDWWSSDHTYSGDAHNLSIEARAGGCWCEKLPNQAGVKHAEVVYLQPGATLRMIGAVGPLQEMGVAGSMTFTLKKEVNGTKLELKYAVGGYSPQGLASIAVPVNQVLTEQVMRLKSYVETGNPVAKSENASPK